jgi:hypothetical protein
MIVWSGKGFVAVLVFVACMVVFTRILATEQFDYALMLSFFVTGAFSWFMGNRWNNKEGRTMVDKNSGQEVVFKPNHGLFWIKLQYWGPILAVAGLVLLVQQFI